MIKKLTKAIEESKIEKERLVSEKVALMSVFKEIEVKAFTVQENYKKTQEVGLTSFFSVFWSQIFQKYDLKLLCMYLSTAYG